MDARPLASRDQVAEFLDVPKQTLNYWAHKGTGPTYVRVGRHTKYRWDDVEAWLDARAVGPGAASAR